MGVFGQRTSSAPVRWINLKGISQVEVAKPKPKKGETPEGEFPDGMPHFSMKEGDDEVKTSVIEGYIKGVKVEKNQDTTKSDSVIFSLEDTDGNAFNLSAYMSGPIRDILNNIIDETELFSIRISLDKEPKEQGGGNWLKTYVSVNGKYSAGKWSGWKKTNWHLTPAQRKEMQEVIKDGRGNFIKTDNFKLDEYYFSKIPGILKAIENGADHEIKDDKEFTGNEGKEKDILDELAEVEKGNS